MLDRYRGQLSVMSASRQNVRPSHESYRLFDHLKLKEEKKININFPNLKTFSIRQMFMHYLRVQHTNTYINNH